MYKLNLGAGEAPLEGYENLDHKTGNEIYPLPDIEDGSVDEVRASHVLEHFSHQEVEKVLREWVRVLKPNGVLKIAVPDFEWIAANYLKGNPFNVQGYTMGGQVDDDDYHKTIFDSEELTNLMRNVGISNIQPWKSDEQDCAGLPVSLNLMGTKTDPITTVEVATMNVAAAMSVPRLGFMDNFFCSFEALLPLKIPMRKHTGAFWGQCLERCIDEWLEEGKDWILTIDYDTVYTRQHVEELLRLARDHPEADAIAPIQASRTRNNMLMTVKDPESGKPMSQIPREFTDAELMKISTAHFGLTLIKAEKLRAMARPLFMGVPGDEGRWDKTRTDDDVYFWREWENAGNTLYLANRIPVGHAELMIRWPDADLKPVYQHPSAFYADGLPENVWQ